MVWAGLVSVGLTLLFLAARRQFPLGSAGGARLATWRDEILTGGAPTIDLPGAGPTRVAGAILWLLVFAACLHDGTDDDEERGPAVLALLPLLLMGAIFAVGLPAAQGATGAKPAHLVALALAASGIAVVFYVRRRRRSR